MAKTHIKMKNRISNAIFLGLAMLCLAVSSHAQSARMDLSIKDGNLSFAVNFKGRPIIPASSLGMVVDNRNLGQNVSFTPVDVAEGKCYDVKTDGKTVFFLDVREFDDGIAFRYRMPSSGPVCVYGELTSFTFPEETEVWYASGPFQYGWIQNYQKRQIDSIANQLLAPPATFCLPDGSFAAITEANLFNFHGAVLFGEEDNKVCFGYVENKWHIESGHLTGLPVGNMRHSAVRNYPWIVFPEKGKKEILSPWRILMLSEDLDGLVNNKIIRQVCDAPDETLFPQGEDTPWIKPGRSVFTWLVEDEDRISVSVIKKYIDGASELGLESVIIDDGWERWGETENGGKDKWEYLADLVSYARSKNVDIWVWRASSPRPKNKTDAGLLDKDERRTFMKKCSEIGVRGLKIDFLHSENLFTVNFMEDILRDAAKEHLMVIFHGVNKPTGDCYTYPNMLAKEAVRGLECVGAERTWAPGAPWPIHDTVLPFTRWLAGPADYTPLNFRRACSPSVTFAHQMASIYMFTSPMLILAADMDDMLECPAREFIEEVPVEWDESYVLQESTIGELAAIARRKGDVWYLSVLNGLSEGSISFRLPFLLHGDYLMTSVSDTGRRGLTVNEEKIRSSEKLELSLLSGGGWLAKFEKIR